MNELDTNLLRERLKSDEKIRHEFLRTFATNKEFNDSADEAIKTYRSLNEKIDSNSFKVFLFDNDFQLCEQVIIRALDSKNARVCQWDVKEFRDFYIYRTTTQDILVGNSKGSVGSMVYEKYYYGDLPA